MTITLAEAIAALPSLVAKAEAGEEVLIQNTTQQPTVKIVPMSPSSSRLTPNPDLAAALRILDQEAVVKPLPPEEWGDWAK